MSTLRLSRNLAIVLLVAGAYFVAGKIGLRLAFVNASATAVWPPTGIALAALLIFGYRVWPGVLVGAFLVNFTTAGTPATSVGIAIGNTLEGVLGAWLVRRFASGPQAFEQPQNVFRFAALAGVIAPVVSATVGVTSLAWGGFVTPLALGATWLTWWLGDMAGALVVGPLLILWSRASQERWTPARLIEGLLMMASLSALSVWVFAELGPLRGHNYPLGFLCVPLLLWAAFRLTSLEAATATTALSALAIWGTLNGHGPFGRFDPRESLLLLQAFMAVTAVMVLAVGASVAERRESDARVRQLNEALERRVFEATGMLRAANLELEEQIRERAHASMELVRSEGRLREAQSVARIGSWEWDIDRNVVWWSEVLYDMYGLDPASFGASYEAFLERVHPDDRDDVHRTVSEALERRRPFRMEHRIVRPDGTVSHHHGEGRVQLDAGGRVVRMIGIGQDVTERRRAEEERANLIREQAAGREAEKANRLKDEFLAMLSHELRTPLNAIVEWARLLRDGSLDVRGRQQAIAAINRNADLQSRLILDLLDLSRIASGRLELRVEPLDPEAVVENALDMVRPAADARGVQLLTQVRTEGPVLGDPARLQQVLANLLSNAIRFSPDRGRVMVTLTCGGGNFHLRVEDEGPGIAAELLPHVFDRFRGAELSHRQGGLGLGLTIVKHLVELHGGTVRAGNREGGCGAVFDVSLPTPPVAGARAGAVAARSAEAAVPEPLPLGGLRILVVEDDVDSREALALLLSGWGADVVAVGSCAEAMAAFESQPPDLLISDIGMPGEDGYALIGRVRALPPERGGVVTAIALTAYAGSEHERRALASGFDAHLSKPFEPRELVAVIERLTPRMPVD